MKWRLKTWPIDLCMRNKGSGTTASQTEAIEILSDNIEKNLKIL